MITVNKIVPAQKIKISISQILKGFKSVLPPITYSGFQKNDVKLRLGKDLLIVLPTRDLPVLKIS